VEQTNNYKVQIITLSDGSSVLLKPNSKLSYPKYLIEINVKYTLSGEGFLKSVKNPKNHFCIANEI
jgi:hypothetical protein